MARKEKIVEERIDYYLLMGYIFLLLGLSLMFLGSIGIILSIFLYPKIYTDQVLLSGLYFFDVYMVVLGMILFFFHKKILIKGRRI